MLIPYYDRWPITLYNGDAMAVLKGLPSDAFDAIVTDPPYSSGGFTRSDRAADPKTKYLRAVSQLPTFSGDNRDARSWGYWSTLWLAEAFRAVKPGGYCLIFSDWRQLPTASDAIQAAGWIWRGVIAWDKTDCARAPNVAYFRHQVEYILWGTKGPTLKDAAGPWPGAYRLPMRREDRFHVTPKPPALLAALLECVPEGGLVLDPFCGAGTTLVAAAQSGRRAVGVEQSAEYCEVTVQRLASNLFAAGEIRATEPKTL